MTSCDENESLGYEGFMWEPEYYEEELFERLSDPEDGDLWHTRSADLSRCTCSFCAAIPSLKEYIYAAKNLSITRQLEYLSDNTVCITYHEDF